MDNPRVGVAIFVFKDGKFLMGKRVGKHGQGSWSVPGGWLEYQETFEDASKREIKEETNLDIKNITFGALTNNIFKNEDVHSLTVWMMSEYDSGEVAIMEPDKFVEMGWYDLDSLPEPLFMPWEHLLVSEFMDTIKAFANQIDN